MGVDIYLHWDGQTEEEREAQFTGYSVVHGHVGYLREAYHGSPYVTQHLFPEARTHSNRDDGVDGCEIPAAVLRERLPEALLLADERQRKVYDYDPTTATDEEKKLHEQIKKAFVDFVELVEKLESEGKHPRIVYSG